MAKTLEERKAELVKRGEELDKTLANAHGLVQQLVSEQNAIRGQYALVNDLIAERDKDKKLEPSPSAKK